MVKQALTGNTITRLIKRIKQDSHRKLAKDWNSSMDNGATCYGRQIGFDTRRIYLNGFQKICEFLREDCQNLYEATIKAIEKLKPEQYSTRKHVKECAISLCKFLLHKKGEDRHE